MPSQFDYLCMESTAHSFLLHALAEVLGRTRETDVTCNAWPEILQDGFMLRFLNDDVGLVLSEAASLI